MLWMCRFCETRHQPLASLGRTSQRRRSFGRSEDASLARRPSCIAQAPPADTKRTPPRPRRAPRIAPPLVRRASLRPRGAALRNQQRAPHESIVAHVPQSSRSDNRLFAPRAERRARLPLVRRRREIARREERRELRPPEGAVGGHVDIRGPAEAVAERAVFHLQPRRRRGGRRGAAGAARAGRGPTPRGARTRCPGRPWARRRPWTTRRRSRCPSRASSKPRRRTRFSDSRTNRSRRRCRARTPSSAAPARGTGSRSSPRPPRTSGASARAPPERRRFPEPTRRELRDRGVRNEPAPGPGVGLHLA